MSGALIPDESLVGRLPLPLAQLYRRAHNGKNPLERHLTAFYLWEATLKLLGSVCVVEYADLGQPEPELADCLHHLARPSLGHWWEFVRRLLPVLADQRPDHFMPLREGLLGKARADMPLAADLDAALRNVLEDKPGGAARVYLAELFDRLVRYRNKEIGHGAAGQRPPQFYEEMGRSLLQAMAELFERLDMLTGSRLLFLPDVRAVQDHWLIERFELVGETARRLESWTLPRENFAQLEKKGTVPLIQGDSPLFFQQLPHVGQVYLARTGDGDSAGVLPMLVRLHPLMAYDLDANEYTFLNARRGKANTEYLCYTTGLTSLRPDLGSEQRELLARALGMAEVSVDLARTWALQSQSEESQVSDEPASPRRLGEYELFSELGRGGMGIVYRAWQPSLGRQVALKCLAQPGDPKAEARFRREIRALGRVEHPHLVKVFASGSDGDKWFYIMELVEGVPLSAVCDKLATSVASVTEVDVPLWQTALESACAEARRLEKPLNDTHVEPMPAPPAQPLTPRRGRKDYVARIVTLMQQVAEATHALHERGIIHRDIKPGNIMVSPDGTRATLMDLGLAQLADDVEGRLTRTRQFVGTLRYASPEQVLAVGRLDRRSDIYSLGATLWELLALRPLFGATEQLPTPLLMEKIQREEPARLRDLHAGLSRNLEAVVHKCLEKSPEKRYATAYELAEDLRRVQEGEPVKARPVGRVDRTLRWTRRHPAQTAAFILLACTAAALAVGFVLVNRERVRKEQAYADLAITNTQLVEEQARTKEQRDTARAQKQRADDRYRQARAAMNRMLARLNDRQLAATPRLKELYEAQLEDAISFYEELLREKGPLDPSVQRDVAGAFEQAGVIQAKLSLTAQGSKSFHRAVDLWQGLINRFPDALDDQAELAVCYSGLAWTEQGDWVQKALAVRERLCRLRPENAAWQEALAETYHNLAASRQAAGDVTGAKALYEKALTILTTLHSRTPDDPSPRTEAANNCAALGLCYMASNQPDRAEAVFRQGEGLLKPLVDKSAEPEPALFLASLYINWAVFTRTVRHQSDTAARLAGHAIDLTEKILRQEPRYHQAQEACLEAHGEHAYASDRPGHYEEEIRDWERVLELCPEQERPRYRALRGWALYHARKYADVTATARQLGNDSKTPSVFVYEAAKLAAAAGHQAKEDPALEPSVRAILAEENAVLAVHLLERLQQAGIFKNPFDALRLSLESAFDWLRNRADFRKLQRTIAHQKPNHG